MPLNKKIISVGSRDFVVTESRTPALNEETAKDLPALQARIAADAQDHDAFYLLGRAYFHLVKFNDALEAIARAIEIRGDVATYHFQLGQCHIEMGLIEEGISCFQEALRLDANFYAVHLAVGFAYLQTKKPSEAMAHFYAALKIDGTLVDAFVGIGQAYSLVGNHSKALRCLERARAMQPDWSRVHVEIGRALESADKYEEAVASLKTAIELNQQDALAHACLSQTLQILGRFPEAIHHLRRSVELNPDNLGYLITLLVKSGHEVDAQTISQAEEMLATAFTGKPGLAEIFAFSLAELYKKNGNFGRSIELLKMGGKLVKQRHQPAYLAADTDQYFDRIIDVFSEQNISRLSRHALSDDTPIFVLGMMRSGTTLVEQILSSHPLVHGAGELSFIKRLCQNFDMSQGIAFPENFRNINEDACQFLGQQYLRQLRALAPEAKYIVDKMPHNFQLIGAIKSLLPNARIIHCVRNPIDTCLSCFQQLFAAEHPATYDMRDMGLYYHSYRRLMEHWINLFGASIHTVVYEEMVANHETEVRRLLDACGLPFDDACLSFFAKDRPVKTASLHQVRQPIYQDSVGKRNHYEPFIGELIESLAPCL